MSGERDIATLFANMKAVLREEVFVFVTIANGRIPDGLTPQMQFCEPQGMTLIITKEQAEGHHLHYDFASHMITLDIHSSLEAVGFMAHISGKLAEAGIPVNPVAGFYHDHLFVPVDKSKQAMMVLAQISERR